MPDPHEVSRFRARSFEVTLHTLDEQGRPSRRLLEGQTTSISRIGVGVRGNEVSLAEDNQITDFQNSPLKIEFHTIDSVLEDVVGQVKKIGTSNVPRYKWYFGMVFREELDLSTLGRSPSRSQSLYD